MAINPLRTTVRANCKENTVSRRDLIYNLNKINHYIYRVCNTSTVFYTESRWNFPKSRVFCYIIIANKKEEKRVKNVFVIFRNVFFFHCSDAKMVKNASVTKTRYCKIYKFQQCRSRVQIYYNRVLNIIIGKTI